MTMITRSALFRWLDEMAEELPLIAPSYVEGILLYRQVSKSSEVAMARERPVLSPKEVFFPSTEVLFTINKNGDKLRLNETLPVKEQVVFGVKACDARGLSSLDAMFIDTAPADPYYAAQRKLTTVIGMKCKEMGETCFCTELGLSPDDPSGVDISLAEFEEGFDVQVMTQKGLDLLNRYLQDGADFYIDRSPLSGCTDATQPTRVVLPEAKTFPLLFEDAMWDEVAERCLSCRICAYACPTCRCFDIRDEELPASAGERRFERIRCWDSCTRNAYRRTAGGHDPRAGKGERLRNRIYCKYYYFPRRYGQLSCTGCGRCIDLCPVNIDITEILRRIVEVRQFP